MTEADILARSEAIPGRSAGIAERISRLEAAPAALRERPAAAGLTDESVCPTLLSKDSQTRGAGAFACPPGSSPRLTRAPPPGAPRIPPARPKAGRRGGPPPSAPGRRSSADWETLLGGNWLNKIGAFVLGVGIALALGYSFRSEEHTSELQ